MSSAPHRGSASRPLLAAAATAAVALVPLALAAFAGESSDDLGSAVKPPPARQLPAGRLANGRSATAPGSETVTVVAEPQDGTNLVAYHGKGGDLCLGFMGRGLGGAACPAELQRGAPEHIYVEGYNREDGTAVAWGFAPSRAERLVATDSDGAEVSVQLFDGGADFNRVRFFLTPLNLSAGEVTLQALDSNGNIVLERQAGSQTPPPPP